VDPNDVASAVRQAAAGDKSAWDFIVDHFSSMLWVVASGFRLGHADTAEVIQTTWLRLVEHLDTIKQPEALPGWLATTARREALRMLRLRGREVLAEDVQMLQAPTVDGQPGPEKAALAAERKRLVWKAFGQLPDNCQVLLHLLTVVMPTYAQVAELLEMPIGSIGPTRARCLKRLQALIAELGLTDGEGS
jgi:RNA polymerase sigma factor (sigma-70 family)